MRYINSDHPHTIEECFPELGQDTPHKHPMTYRVPPLIDALKKYTGWFPGYGLESAYAPAGLSGGSAAPAGTPLGFSRFASPRPLDLFLFCLFVFTAISYASSPKRKLPPHPRRTPIIGNLSQMTDKKWLFSRECKEQFGECHRDWTDDWKSTDGRVRL